jgi:hypothetical protein
LLDVPIPGAEGDNLHDAFDDLAAYSLVTLDATGPFFLVHRLVQDVTRRGLTGEMRHRRLVEALGWIHVAFTGEAADLRNWPRLDSLESHARAVATHAEAAGIAEPTTTLLGALGVLEHFHGE